MINSIILYVILKLLLFVNYMQHSIYFVFLHRFSIFNFYTDSVFCLDMTTDGSLIVSGGEDDMAYVWRNNAQQEVILECTGGSTIYISLI